MSSVVPSDVLRAATGSDVALQVVEEPIHGSSGAATAEVVRLTETVVTHGQKRPFSVIHKTVRPLSTGRHAEMATRPDHWAYWRREPLAYAAAVLPTGPGFRAPRCFGVHHDTAYLEDVAGGREDPRRAAEGLCRWQATSRVPSVDWLAAHQLEQRIAVTHLDWTTVDADPRAVAMWEARDRLLDELAVLPRVLSHGDYSLGNLIAADDGDTVALDWGTLGAAPAGADLAHLALSSLTDPLPAYLAASLDGPSPDDVSLGYRTTLVLTGSSRLHWMLSNSVPVPAGYVDFLQEHRPPVLRPEHL
ncbi:phosphotransferase [Motilibacter rhizosphaerae]|uniref:phosphotransferase n=1 Tax=Motilibacter rhizosphaerae TaxID=598652 RepID=UPI001E2BE77E|nr:phosphotransferase [Motilibacter rhizosphaerae]